MATVTDPLWAPRPERSIWEQITAVMGWYQWALVVGALLALLLVLLAWLGLRGDTALDRRPPRLPARRPGAHRAAGRPPAPGRVQWLGGSDSQGWWIWSNDEPGDW